MRKAIETNNGLKGGLLKGKAHYDSNGNPLGGIKAVVTDQGGKPIEVEGNEVIINKKTVQSDKVLTVKGTPKEILSTLNQMDGNGVAIGDEEAEILAKYRVGGSIPKEIIMYHGSKSKFDKFNMINNTLRGIELGSHFGTYEQAKSFMSERYGENDKFYIYKCKLNLENTLKVDDIGWWTADNIYRFILKNKRYKLEFNDIDISTPENILKILKEKNIDSFKYSNLHEGEGYSYLVFDSSKIEILDTEIFRNGGELIKRADGSYSRRGLWDNIRDNVGSGRKPTKQMLEQEAKIKSKYHLGGDMSKHLAPNGKLSNLNHEQWHLVRTPEFKAWFGDWENDPENSSKVVDDNGEPKIMYRGNPKEQEDLGYTFNKGYNFLNKKSNNDFGFFFTDDIDVAKKYTKVNIWGEIQGGSITQVFLNVKNLFDLTELGIITNGNNFIQYLEIKGISFKGYEKLKLDVLEYERTYDKIDVKQWHTPNIYDFFDVFPELKDLFQDRDYNAVVFKEISRYYSPYLTYAIFEPNQIKLADGSNTTFDENNDDIRFKTGGSIANMTKSELKEFYDSPEGKKLDAQTYSEWKRLVNMTKSELEKFYNSVEGKKAGLSSSEANRQGIDSGRESARWIMKMKDIPYTQWTSNMWRWAKKQISFIKRMSGMEGELYDEKGRKTRKHTALLIWGHNPEQKFKGGGDVKGYDNFKNPILINGFISNKKIDGKEIFLITYNSGGQEGLNVHQTMNPLAMLDAVEKKTGLHTNTLQVFIYEHTENSNRIETEDELEFLKDNYTVIIVDRDSVEFYNGDNPEQKFAGGGRLRKFRGGGELSQKALAVETNDLTDFVRKYFIKDGRIDVSDAMQELFGNKRGKSVADEYRKRIGLHKKDGLTISQLAHKLWEEHRDEVRDDIDDSDFRNAVEEVLISEYGVSSMIKSLMEKSGESEQDRENEYWMNQFDEGDDEYYEDLSDEEVADYFRDMEGFERELAKGTEHEMEHLDTLKKVAEGKLTPEEGVVQTSLTHIKENPNYYEYLQKMELEALKDKLKNQGYNVTIPYGGNRISVIGYGKGYFNAKKQKADSILSSLKRNGYNAVSELDADGYYDFWVYSNEPKQDLAKMEKENKETYTYALTLRPFDIGTYPKENFIRLIKENYKFGLLEYSKPLSDRDIKHYSLAPVSELMKYDGKEYYYYEDFKAKMNVIRDEDNTPFAKVTEFDENNDVVQEYTINSNVFLQKIESLNYRFIDDSASEEESIPELIEGLKVLADSLEGAEKKEIEDVIEGLEILLESDDKFARGGEFRMATGGKIVFKPITTPL